MISIHIGNKLRLWLIQLDYLILINCVMQHRVINLKGIELIFSHNIHSIMKRNEFKSKYCINKYEARRVYENQNNRSNMCNKIIETDDFNTITCHYDNQINDTLIFNQIINIFPNIDTLKHTNIITFKWNAARYFVLYFSL